MLRRPLIGGVFGQGQYELATTPLISKGLHAVKFMVIEPRAGRVLSIAETKVEALGGARRLLHSASAALPASEPAWQQPTLWSDGGLSAVEPAKAARPVSRRRREVFERSGGKCFYCSTPLKLDGSFHLEHQMPRALGGTDDSMNLVAACASCNLAKADRTAIEYVTAPRTGESTNRSRS